MKRLCMFFLCLIGINQSLAFQSDEIVLATIGDLEIKSGELVYAYQKNNDQEDHLHYDSLKKYLSRYINFKLKVLEAKALGYDTVAALKEELYGYISQIRKPYLANDELEEKLIRQIHNRMKIEIDASHILISVKPNATPTDTLRAYRLIDSLKLATNSQEKFEALAKQFSQDGSARNGGSLGWFTTMDMVGPFENAAYETETGEVSEIVRTRFGYHIVYVNRKRASKGKLKTSHIFFSDQRRSDSEMETFANVIYDSLKSGAAWNYMARKYSQDNKTKMNGGQLPFARIKQLPDDFMDIAYSLEHVGDLSRPEKTQFGWHIVRLDALEPIPAFSEISRDIANSLEKSGRNSLNDNELLKKLKNENDYTQNKRSLKNAITALSGLNEDSIQLLNSSVLFTLGEKTITTKSFLDFIPSRNIALSDDILESLYTDFEKETILAYEDSIAPTKYPEYGYLLKEYEEGLLLFEIMQEEVWNKALLDSVGAKSYYNKNKRKYTVEKRLVIQSVSGLNDEAINKLMTIYSGNDQTLPLEDVAKQQLASSDVALLKIVKRTIKVSEIPNFDPVGLESGNWIRDSTTEEHYFIEEIIPAGHYAFHEIRGLVISDYQDFLDKEWVRQLRQKKKLKINKKGLKSISSN